MDMFLVYVVMCFTPVGGIKGCNDYAPARAFTFKNREYCEVFARKLLDAGRIKGEKQGLIYIDGKAFCLKFMGSKEV